MRVEINKAIEGCRNKQIIGAALETEVNYLPEDKVVKDSLTWLKKFCNEDVDLFRDWLIVSNFTKFLRCRSIKFLFRYCKG